MVSPLSHCIWQAIRPQVDIIVYFHDVVSIKFGSDELQKDQGLCSEAGIGFLQGALLFIICST